MAHLISNLSEYGSIYDEVTMKINQCMDKTQINQMKKMTLKVDLNGKGINAKLNKKNELIFTIETILLFEKNEKDPLFQLLSHRIARLFFKEAKNTGSFISKRHKFFNMIEEVRADIEGKKIFQLADHEISAAFASYKKYNCHQSKECCYNNGTLSYDERVTYILYNNSLNEKLIDTMFKYYVSEYPGKYINPKLKLEAKKRYLLNR
ncbi:MAG: hypothetical protein H7X94_05815 [Vallitaleaceae bacterium]|nr:hypothetical protein [Vallitaleaceae bacterium]